MAFDLTHARHDPAHCLAPGLFRSLKRGERKKQKLDITYQHGANTTLRFIGFEPLDAQDMRLLQGLVAMSGPHGVMLYPEPTTERGQQLRLLLEPTLDAVKMDALVVKGTLGQLMREIGYATDGHQTRKDLKDSLLRMSNVTLQVKDGKKEASFHLLSYVFDEDDGSLYVAINPRIAESVMGNQGFTRIDMQEVRALQSDPARLAHQRLCARIAPGLMGRADLQTICEYIWSTPASDAAMRQRKTTARKVIQELTGIGWAVNEYAKEKYEIRRPASDSEPF